jgi:hypothetical protein
MDMLPGKCRVYHQVFDRGISVEQGDIGFLDDFCPLHGF